jgi:hypothetical protein
MAGMARPQFTLRDMLISVSLLAVSFALFRAAFIIRDGPGVALIVWGTMCIGASLGSAIGAMVGNQGAGMVYGVMAGIPLSCPAGAILAQF